mmetsp:Transcript_10967/g.38175  ORF Transcript_10967/g.38175 Transcript_10967/m.38175 type:complete len:471 (+) Transcript_10967:204-1616(+)
MPRRRPRRRGERGRAGGRSRRRAGSPRWHPLTAARTTTRTAAADSRSVGTSRGRRRAIGRGRTRTHRQLDLVRRRVLCKRAPGAVGRRVGRHARNRARRVQRLGCRVHPSERGAGAGRRRARVVRVDGAAVEGVREELERRALAVTRRDVGGRLAVDARAQARHDAEGQRAPVRAGRVRLLRASAHEQIRHPRHRRLLDLTRDRPQPTQRLHGGVARRAPAGAARALLGREAVVVLRIEVGSRAAQQHDRADVAAHARPVQRRVALAVLRGHCDVQQPLRARRQRARGPVQQRRRRRWRAGDCRCSRRGRRRVERARERRLQRVDLALLVGSDRGVQGRALALNLVQHDLHTQVMSTEASGVERRPLVPQPRQRAGAHGYERRRRLPVAAVARRDQLRPQLALQRVLALQHRRHGERPAAGTNAAKARLRGQGRRRGQHQGGVHAAARRHRVEVGSRGADALVRARLARQ